MAHTDDTVATFHKGNQAKRTHNVIPNGRKRPEPDRTDGRKIRRAQVQTDSRFPERIVSNRNMKPPPLLLKAMMGKRYIPRHVIGNQLYRAGFLPAAGMNRGNHRQRFSVGLTFEIPSAKGIVQSLSSPDLCSELLLPDVRFCIPKTGEIQPNGFSLLKI